MAKTLTEAQIREVVSQVLNSVQSASTTAAFDSTQYGGRKFVGVFEDMNDAIDAITKENGFDDIECAEGEGRDG